ncbi:MAG: energy-coupling factor transporter transmembrane component T [Nakamurella sp.]
MPVQHFARPLPRTLHPGAWWLWAFGLATAASRTTNPALLLLIISVAGLVVALRRSSAPWALSFRLYVIAGALIVVLRVVFRIVFNADGATIVVTLPSIQLPHWFWGATLLGDVSAEALVSALYDGLRLATMVICVGAANALANPKRLLAGLPAALSEISTVLVVAMSVFPQLAESVQRVGRARALRTAAVSTGDGERPARRRRQLVRAVVVPVLADALDRSLALAAAMESRGYGRRRAVPRAVRRLSALLLILGVLGLLVGVYSVFDTNSPPYLTPPMLLGGFGIAAAGLHFAGRRSPRTRYRPDRWQAAEVCVAVSGALVAAGMFTVERVDPLQLLPTIFPPEWPVIGWASVLTVLLGLLALGAPPAPDASTTHHSEHSPTRMKELAR